MTGSNRGGFRCGRTRWWHLPGKALDGCTLYRAPGAVAARSRGRGEERHRRDVSAQQESSRRDCDGTRTRDRWRRSAGRAARADGAARAARDIGRRPPPGRRARSQRARPARGRRVRRSAPGRDPSPRGGAAGARGSSRCSTSAGASSPPSRSSSAAARMIVERDAKARVGDLVLVRPGVAQRRPREGRARARPPGRRRRRARGAHARPRPAPALRSRRRAGGAQGARRGSGPRGRAPRPHRA